MAAVVGQLIKNIRKTSSKTQRKLGQATGISTTRISNIESGNVKATVEEIAAIAQYFENLDIIRAYWSESPLAETSIRICDRLGIQLQTDIDVTAQQFGRDIIARTQRIMQLCADLPQDVVPRQEYILLVGMESLQIVNLATALRMLIGEVHWK